MAASSGNYSKGRGEGAARDTVDPQKSRVDTHFFVFFCFQEYYTMSMWRALSALQLSRAMRSSRARCLGASRRCLALTTNTEGRARYARWVEEIRSTAEPADASSEPCCAAEGAPFLNEVDSLARRLIVYRRPQRSASASTDSTDESTTTTWVIRMFVENTAPSHCLRSEL